MGLALLTAFGFLLASQTGSDDLVARWKFDGDLKDAGPAALPTQAVGRLEFVDSPISGKMAVFNGVDASIEILPASDLGIDGREFTLCTWAFFLDLRPTVLVARPAWALQLKPDGILEWSGNHQDLKTRARAVGWREWIHVAVSVKKLDRGFAQSIWINGESVASIDSVEAEKNPAGAPLWIGKADKAFTGMMDELRIYRRALTRDEICAVVEEGMPWLRPKAHAKTPFAGKFELIQDDVVVFAGGENARVGQELGYLETLLALHAAGKRVHFRNMAWESDTVYEQLRPMNFGSWADQFRRSGATVVFAQFGQIEALEGKAGLERFAAASEALIAQFAQATKRIVLVSPTPFGRGGGRQPDLLARNGDLKLYVDAIRTLAAKNGCLFIDLQTKPLAEEGMTRNGLHLTPEGQWIAARETARQLEIAGLSDLDAPDLNGAFRRESLEKVRLAIRYKNILWNDAWRPTNWAFLNGDRVEQPSGRDHLDRRIRWFPVEIQQLPALLRREEEKIDALIQAEKK